MVNIALHRCVKLKFGPLQSRHKAGAVPAAEPKDFLDE
jgi:hypothetical protein